MRRPLTSRLPWAGIAVALALSLNMSLSPIGPAGAEPAVGKPVAPPETGGERITLTPEGKAPLSLPHLQLM